MYHFILKVSAEFRIPEHTHKYNIDTINSVVTGLGFGLMYIPSVVVR